VHARTYGDVLSGIRVADPPHILTEARAACSRRAAQSTQAAAEDDVEPE